MLAVVAAIFMAASCDKYEHGKPSRSVLAEFDRMYPDARDVEWERTGSEY